MQENQRVSRGQLLFRLDDQPYRLALTKIEAELETQRAEIRGLRAQWRTKREDIKAALSQQVYAQADYDRQFDLAERKFASTQKLEEARLALDVARQRIASGQEDLTRIEAALAGDPKIKVDDHPKVKMMLAARDEALLNLRRATIELPLDGIVAKRPVPGSYATAGVPIMAVVADTDLWIEANFKETELTLVRPGQPATSSRSTPIPTSPGAARWPASPRRPARSSRCCRRRTPPATGSRSCSASRCGSRSNRQTAIRRCASA